MMPHDCMITTLDRRSWNDQFQNTKKVLHPELMETGPSIGDDCK